MSENSFSTSLKLGVGRNREREREREKEDGYRFTMLAVMSYWLFRG